MVKAVQRAADAGGISEQDLRDIERIAVELVRLAGTEIQAALGGLLAVRYKDEVADQMTWRDPVSEVDHNVETLIRARLKDRFPDHDIVGEEMDERSSRDHDVVWSIDPIDGTTNFVNGFPMFASSIGVLYRGAPIAGALWCSTSHALRPGVYHARRGQPLYFDEEVIEPQPNPLVRRRLAGVPHITTDTSFPWEGRKTGSAAIECAFVAARLLSVASFERPNVWDVAGGVALVQAAGGEAWMHEGTAWHPLDRFAPVRIGSGQADLRNWHHPLVIGDREAVARLCGPKAA